MAYVYRLKFVPTHQYYIGYRGSKKSSPEDLLVTYFTSSKVVHALIKKYGVESFKKEILGIFDDSIEAYNYEQKLLMENDIENNDQFLNKRLTAYGQDAFIKHTEKTKRKMSKSRKTLWETPEYKQKISSGVKKSWQDENRILSQQTDEFRNLKKEQTKRLWEDQDYVSKQSNHHLSAVSNPTYKKWHSEHKKKLWQNPDYNRQQSEARKAKWADPEYKKKMSEARKAKWSDPAFKAMMLAARKNKKMVG